MFMLSIVVVLLKVLELFGSDEGVKLCECVCENGVWFCK